MEGAARAAERLVEKIAEGIPDEEADSTPAPPIDVVPDAASGTTKADATPTPAVVPSRDATVPSSVAARKTVSAAEANIVAREYLETAEHPSLRRCADYIRSKTGGSFGNGRVGDLSAWQAHMEQRLSKRPKRTGADPRQLSDAVLAVRKGADADPSEIAAEKEQLEIAERRYLESLSEAERGKYHSLSTEEKMARIGEFLANEADAR
jgi:hypothetical protein